MKFTAILEVLKLILQWINEARVRGENKGAQDERDEIEENPGEWLNGHFGGVRDDKTRGKTEADKASD